jgi:hypothetical protein
MRLCQRGFGLCFALLLGLWGAPASALTLAFDGDHGELITDDYLADFGITIEVDRLSPGPAIAMLYDSLVTGGLDYDLEQNGGWSLGNLSPGSVLGTLLVIPEDVEDGNGDGLVDQPSDEGDRPAGRISLIYSTSITEFGFDLIDIEIMEEMGFVEFYSGAALVGTVQFSDFIDPTSPYYDPSIVFGDDSANRIQPILASAFQASGFDKVIVQLGGSGAIDNVTAVPEPTTLALLGAGLGGLAFLGRRRALR